VNKPTIESRLEAVRKKFTTENIDLALATKSTVTDCVREGFDKCKDEILPLLNDAVEMAKFYNNISNVEFSMCDFGPKTIASEFLVKVEAFAKGEK